MAITIDSPVNASTGNPNPLRVEGTASAADSVQVRLERSDGQVYDGAGFIDDRTHYTPVANGSDGISASVDVTAYDRFWQTGNERFNVEAGVTFTNSSTGSIQYFASTYRTGPVVKLFTMHVTGTGDPQMTIWDDAGTALFLGSTGSAHVDGDQWDLRFIVDRTNPKLYERINSGTWAELALTTNTLSANANPLGNAATPPADLTVFPFEFGNLTPSETTQELTAGSVRYFKTTAHDGTTIVDLDMTRDADDGHSDADPILDATGQTWTKTGGSVERVRSDHLFTAFGITDWFWDTPILLDGLEHTIAGRTLTGTTGGTWATSAFTSGGGVAVVGDRFAQIGITKYLWATVVADINNPTFAELAAAVDLTSDVRAVSGLQANHARTVRTVANSSQARSFPGLVAREPSLIMYDRTNNTSPFRDLFVQGSTGFLVVVPYGSPWVVGDPVLVYPARSAGNGSSFTTDAAAAVFVIDLALTGDMANTTIAL